VWRLMCRLSRCAYTAWCQSRILGANFEQSIHCQLESIFRPESAFELWVLRLVSRSYTESRSYRQSRILPPLLPCDIRPPPCTTHNRDEHSATASVCSQHRRGNLSPMPITQPTAVSRHSHQCYTPTPISRWMDTHLPQHPLLLGVVDRWNHAVDCWFKYTEAPSNEQPKPTLQRLRLSLGLELNARLLKVVERHPYAPCL
jgi:hypothetical protein